MLSIELPISKSIANRLLILQAVHGDPLMPVDSTMPHDVLLMHESLTKLRYLVHNERVTLNLDNCGTAMRFLTAYCALLEKREVVLQGSERMHQRPIKQLVDSLRTLGAHIQYLKDDGFPPLYIKPCEWDIKNKNITIRHPLSSQFVSALLLIGVNVETNIASPYIAMTKQMVDDYPRCVIERDWSSAAFWYEYMALHDMPEIFFPHLSLPSLQGDDAVAQLFEPLGVHTNVLENGCRITKINCPRPRTLTIDFTAIPDLYPPIFATCRALNITLNATGLNALQHKESDRIQTVQSTFETFDDHRIAMALLAADHQIDNADCIKKSYPQFVGQYQAISATHKTV